MAKTSKTTQSDSEKGKTEAERLKPKIEQLTPEQLARCPEFVEKWIKIGLCCEPANRPVAEEGVREAYKTVGLKPPDYILWSKSPMAMIIERGIAVSCQDDGPDEPSWFRVRDLLVPLLEKLYAEESSPATN